MSVDNLALDLSRLSFDTTPDLLATNNTPLLASRPKSRNNNAPSITITQEKKTPRSRDRNRQCVPSDDEDSDEEDEDVDSSDDEDTYQKKKGVVKRKTKKPLPSDDEDEDDDEEEDNDSDAEQRPSPMYRRISGVGSTSNLHGRSPTPQQRPNAELAKRYSDGGNHQYDSEYRHSTDEYFVEGSHLHHLQQMQHHHHTQLAQFQHQQPSFLRPQQQQQQQQQRVSMSGMDLLKQLEQEKAEAKRQKPKLNPSNVKIEKGLLANLPEPGSHNISFQQMAMQQQHHHHHHHQGKPRHQRSASSLENNNKQHRQQQQQQQHQHQHQHHHQQQQQQQYGYYPAHAVPAAPVGYMYPQQQQQQLVYPYLNAANNGGLMSSQSFNASSPSIVMLDTHQPSRPGSALSNSSRRRSND